MAQSEVHIDPARLQNALVSEKTSAPIFIMGIMPRSGTNFLHRLICQHPDCGAINTTPVREDYMMHHAAWLSKYLKRLKWQWGHWGADGEFVEPLYRGVGHGMSDFLSTLTESPRFVTKTPSVQNLSLFFKFFPTAYLLIIVRDGRSVVASGMSGFGWKFETAARHWARSARQIQAFEKQNQANVDRFRIVKYESLNGRTAEEIMDILGFLQLDPDRYDLASAMETPVYGSSYLKEGDSQMTWQPKKKTEEFGSQNRWDSWSTFEHQRFNRIAGKELNAFGYEPVLTKTTLPQRGRHAILDTSQRFKRFSQTVLRAAKEGGRAFRDEVRGSSSSKVDLKR